ncbi:MAG: aldose 1-epimerase [Pseudomonadota bacterium]
MKRVALSNGDLFLELDPEAGGTVSALRHGRLPILRAGPDRTGSTFDAREYSAFPMLPFVGRIHNARCPFNGRTVQLPMNLPPEPHAIHGHGWQSNWQVENKSQVAATMTYQHVTAEWPWHYSARQSFRLHADGLDVTLSLTNRAESPMPAGFGWHPYFPKTDATLRLATTQRWTSSNTTGDNQPRALTRHDDLSYLRRVESLQLDTTFSIQPEPIELVWPTHSITIECDRIFSHATVFTPSGKNYFCVEPVSHVPNAVNSTLPHRETGLHLLAPGETMSGSLTLRIAF